MDFSMQAEILESMDEVASKSEHHAISNEKLNEKKFIAGVVHAEGKKCDRCWNYSTQVGKSEKHPNLCERCLPVINELGFELPSPQAVAA